MQIIDKPSLDKPSSISAVTARVAVVPIGLAITGIICVAMNLRPGIVSIGPVLPFIRDDFHLSHGTAALLTSIPDVLMGLLALPTPWLARRIGRDDVMLLALTLLLLSTGLRAFSHSTASLLLCTAGVGAGIAIAGTLIGGFIKAEFSSRLAIVMGVYATALAVGSVAAAALTAPIAARSATGWRFGVGIWSPLCVVALVVWTVVKVHVSPSGDKSGVTADRIPLPLGKGIAWSIAIFFGVNNLLFYACLTWTATIYKELGYSNTESGFILATFALASLMGNPVFGALSRSRDRRLWLALACAICCMGLAGIAWFPRLYPYLWVSLVAFGQAGGFTLGMTLPLDNTETVEETDVWNAFTFTVGYLVAASGPVLVGILRDRTGSFLIPNLGLVGVGVVMLLLTAALRPRTFVSK